MNGVTASSAGRISSKFNASGAAFNVPLPSINIRLLSGELNKNSEVDIYGSTIHEFSVTTNARTVTWIPGYGEGDLSQLDKTARTAVMTMLKTKPVIRAASNFTVRVYDDFVSSLDSITTASPSPETNSDQPGNLEWIGHSYLEVRYVAQDPSSADTISNALFVFAILLGIAGAGILTSMQGFIHTSSHVKKDQR